MSTQVLAFIFARLIFAHRRASDFLEDDSLAALLAPPACHNSPVFGRSVHTPPTCERMHKHFRKTCVDQTLPAFGEESLRFVMAARYSETVFRDDSAEFGARAGQRTFPLEDLLWHVSCQQTCADLVSREVLVYDGDEFARLGLNASSSSWETGFHYVAGLYNESVDIALSVPGVSTYITMESFVKPHRILYWHQQGYSGFALFIYPEIDEQGAFYFDNFACEHVKCMLAQRGLGVIVARVGSVAAARGLVGALPGGSLEAVVLAGHGSPTSLAWGPEGAGGLLTTVDSPGLRPGSTRRESAAFLAALDQRLAERQADVFLQACGCAGRLKSKASGHSWRCCFNMFQPREPHNFFEFTVKSLPNARRVYASRCAMGRLQMSYGSNCMPNDIRNPNTNLPALRIGGLGDVVVTRDEGNDSQARDASAQTDPTFSEMEELD